ncbi:N-acetylglucosamine-6-phosphate deacetylase [Streptomyces griseochromogenes]|uniref:N-acetylglucosamine-6-phosphate deacetylase n=1 Tax=Streptomyces griseochromogenes TaxID=68214 RepID=A0ABS4M0V8_9ACTN|nr:hypothetical protein [Streptomyces griseochromogenes]MBP2053026.1 N-acetylglucosamine-6-phosphate deacetylase [Streptomyces griseochromogenes]
MIWNEGRLTVAEPAAADVAGSDGYFVPSLPVEVHCHGLGDVDFSDFSRMDLKQLNEAARGEGIVCIPTLYLRQERLDDFVVFMREFSQMRDDGTLPYVGAMALEGPLVASFGGTPASSVWAPSREEWAKLASCGPLGLVYLMLSPDALTPGSYVAPSLPAGYPDLEWIVTTLVEAGVRPALGHFTREDPQLGADCVETAIGAAEAADFPGDGVRVITDHLFNEMPLLIKHAFRTSRAKAERDRVIASYDLPSWNLADLHEQIGPVPATIIRAAHAGRITACLNFDGEHVDFAIARRAVELAGPSNMMLMTDRSDTANLGGQHLHREAENSLWYQHEGVVAAGTQPIDKQIANVRSLGVPESDIWHLVSFTAHRTFFPEADLLSKAPERGCFVLGDGKRIAVG